MTKVKICGIMDMEAAIAAAEAGADFLGIIFAPGRRRISPEKGKELAEAIIELWSEHGNNRERVGEFMQRVGLGNFLEQIGLDPIPEMVIQPRTNPYIFFEKNEEE